jgi:uncharacterized protein
MSIISRVSLVNMIPGYPKFRKLKLTDKKEIEGITKKFEPYSDFNFGSMWSWDVDQGTQIANLNGNLVVKFLDYIDGSVFWSFIGDNKIVKTVETLLVATPVLKLVPEAMILKLDGAPGIKYKEDPDNFDYILDMQKTSTLNGNKLGPKRNFVNRFGRFYGEKVKTTVLDLEKLENRKKIIELFDVWEKGRSKARSETERELTAVKRILKSAGSLNLVAVGVWDKDKLIGFSINEKVQMDYAMIHFEKADVAYVGVFEYLKQQSAKILLESGCRLINYEQDLGLVGLRKAKLSWQPVSYIKKYILEKAT